MSRILCIIDGMNDSCFDVQKYPNLASFPIRKCINTVPDGFEPETLPCVLYLLGITAPPQNIRGWVEALGATAEINSDDLIFRGSWIELSDAGTCKRFCKAPDSIPELGSVRYVSLGDYRGLLIVPKHSHYVDSIKTSMPFDILGKSIHEFAHPNIAVLKDALEMLNTLNPNRSIFPWAPSSVQTLPKYPQKAAVVCGTNVIKGIAKAMDMHLITTDAMTGDVDTDLEEKLTATLDAAKSYPFVLLHIGGSDEASHRMNILQKKEFLLKVDNVVLSKLLKSRHWIEVVSDHGSDPKTGKHIGGRQPYFHF